MRLLQILAAACAAFGALPAAARAAPDDSGAYHIFPMSALLATHPDPAARVRNAARTMLYFGGPVLPRIKVVSVIWGSDVNRATVKNIGPFLSGLVNSSFVDQLKQYSTNFATMNGHAGTHQTIVRGAYKGQFAIVPSHKATSLTDAAIQAELRTQIAGKHLPAADQSTLYMVYFPSYITITAGKSISCRDFGAYHSANPRTAGSNIFYGVMPDCSLGFAAETIASSHEFAEALTDGIPTPGSHPAYPQAWNTSDGYEVADLCQGTRGMLAAAGKNYAVTQVFLNTTKACGTGNYNSP